MNNDLFVPKKIKVGFQDRSDTFTKRLAYVIYYDSKGILRKETSWNSWRDKKIEPEEFDNTPQSGFVINKNVERYKWSHFSSQRSYIRIYDPRGIEFEVTPENLIGILMNSDCSKRALIGDFVYAWHGKDLLLLPTSAEEYSKAMQYTKLQGQKISAKTLVPGRSYKTKKGGDVIYVGRFDWYDWFENNKREKYFSYCQKSGLERKCEKLHIFTENDGKTFITKSSVDFLAECNGDDVVLNYADIVDKFKSAHQSSQIVSWSFTPSGADFTVKNGAYDHYHPGLVNAHYTSLNGDVVDFYRLEALYNTDRSIDENGNSKYNHKLLGYRLFKVSSLDLSTKKFLNQEQVCYPAGATNTYWWSQSLGKNTKLFEPADLTKFNLGVLTVTLESGATVKVTSETDLF